MVNETKTTSRNAFINNVFALKSEKESRNDKKTLFWDYAWIPDLTVNPYTGSATYVWFPGLS